VLPAPSITSLSPTSERLEHPSQNYGTNLVQVRGTSTVTFNGDCGNSDSLGSQFNYRAGSDRSHDGNVVVTVSGVISNGVSFTVLPAPSITSLFRLPERLEHPSRYGKRIWCKSGH